MKKMIMICLIALSQLKGYGQEIPQRKSEIRVGYGLVPVQEIGTLLGDWITMGIVGRRVESTEGTGAISAGYSLNLTQRFSVGIDGFYGKNTVRYKDDLGDSKWSTYGGLVNAKYLYLDRGKLNLYGKGAVGYAQYHNRQKENSDNFGALSYQASPFGIRYGNKIGVYGEFGFGYLGIANVGVSFKL
ncbi:porin family protein [Sphingobacterium sp. BIGb0165]|uniref:porin family protein n=1 Tax=Sphingobacterium sp. BIGb0165 TaxID=2940615 RepID=UPI002167ED26|nr:porin family protein [Sphingobacterium sp. BIGb0165]MCS4224022.1 hypothetical protein [Sphingobacterium sp. BIGb0165]